MSDEKLDRFARGELSPIESRELAQQALDDPELFDELTYTAVARRSLTPRKHWVRFALPVAAAAAVVIAMLSRYAITPWRTVPVPPAATTSAPVLIARSDHSGAVFRGIEPESRAPRTAGSVTSVTDGLVTIDLGSLDGLAKGEDVEVVRDGTVIGRIELTTIFRERARGTAPERVTIRPKDQVRVPPAARTRAALDQIAALSARGDSEGALRVAKEAAVSVPAEISAAGHEDLNNLGAIAELRGERQRARSLYEQALRARPPDKARRAIEVNLARVKGAG